MKKDLVSMKLDRATQLLAEASTIQQAKHIVSLAIAAQSYARQQKLGDEAKRYAKEIELRAKRKLGEVLKVTPKNTGEMGQFKSSSGGTKKEPPDTYKQIGIDKKLAAEAQIIAEIPQALFESHLKTKEPRATYLVREYRDAAKTRERQLQKAKRRWNLKRMLKLIDVAMNTIQREWNHSDPPWGDRELIAQKLIDESENWRTALTVESCGNEIQMGDL